MHAGPFENFRAWLRLYLVGGWVLLLQLLRDLRPPPPFPQPSLRGTTVIVTGASSGIGRALCESLLVRGARVIALLGPNTPSAPAGTPSGAHALRADLRDTAQIQSAASAVSDLLSAGERAILIHAAGTLSPSSPSDCMSVNLIAPVLLSSLLAYHVSASIFLGSSASTASPPPPRPPARLLSPPAAARAAYPYSKSLLPAAADACARTFGRPAVVVHPGVVDTRLYEAEAGVIGGVLRRVVRVVAWTPQRAAERVLEVVRRAGVLGGAGAVSVATYWDATTLAKTPPPWSVTDDEGRVCRWVSGRLWSEVESLNSSSQTMK